MLASTIAGRAAMRASRQSQQKVVAKLTSGATTASPCSNLRSPLPGAYRETTELWHNDKAADVPTDVEVSVHIVERWFFSEKIRLYSSRGSRRASCGVMSLGDQLMQVQALIVVRVTQVCQD